MSDWQPIETAPKDGEFLAYDPIAKKHDICHWEGSLGCFQVQCDGIFGPEEDEFDGTRATHWQPLPNPPKDTE